MTPSRTPSSTQTPSGSATPSQTQTASVSSSPVGLALFDGTAQLTLPLLTPPLAAADATELGGSAALAVSFALYNADPACGWGAYSLTLAGVAISQAPSGGGVAAADVLVSLYALDVSGLESGWSSSTVGEGA